MGISMRLRDRFRSIRFRSSKRGERERVTPATSDPIMSYHRDGHMWTFEEGHILVDGYDVNPVIAEEETTVSTLVGLASGLDDYKKRMELFPVKPPGTGKFMALADALLEKILGKVKKVYDDKIFGVTWKLTGNELLVNGVNVHAFLKLYRLRPTEKAQTFLKGLKAKVETLIVNPSGNFRNENAHVLLRQLKREIDEELEKDAPAAMARRLLPSGDSSR